ncbi:membrane protein, putative [Oceanicola granulosus HTCC2516]|uniref:Phosphatidylglycerol lysyltransferase n=1 Tax=Oceanicola granulosus (strain ATCC BAA-861 / DSM 15982 / KCTC 12143 / HTCC2516) TaxID=314256 RepID=Q2CDD2_OCEGH|nr:phosphatidylglycerol lysyltransferase domain-containing protein [Oceanicola granulosus]EAR50658.1 membrane protein, putative [Oceanicola granulosus HTCC2516]
MTDLRPGALHLVGLTVGALLIWLLVQRLEGVDLAAVADAVRAVSPGRLALAGLAAAASFAALGAYDATVHGALGTGVGTGRARRAGIRAVAVGQVTGMGAIVGALVRWRSLPELTLAQAIHVSALVSLSFMAALLPLAALAAWLFLPAMPGQSALPLLALVALAVILLLPRLSARLPRLAALTGRLGGRPMLRLCLWAALDTGLAALALWLCLPAGAVPFGPLLAAYLVGLGAGLMTNAPGGLGAFELTLLALLPVVPEGELLAAVLLFRLVYFAIPALLALPGLIAPRPPASGLRRADGRQAAALLADAPCPEWALARQQGELRHGPGGALFLSRAPLVLATIGRTLGTAPLDDLAALARDEARLPALYKCDARTAARARAQGWAVLGIARDGRIAPHGWTTAGARHRQLRRKLNQAAGAGLAVQAATAPLPLDAMTGVAAAWAAAHGGERGFSMGTFSPANLRHQRTFLAWHDGALAGFVTFHAAPCGWALDLMRQRPDAPTGTMHALLAAALDTARAEGVGRVSLAAAPDVAGRFAALSRYLPTGLVQFKESFAPRWQPLYLAVPHPLALPVVLAALIWQIRRGHSRRPAAAPVQENDEDFAFAPPAPAWQGASISRCEPPT